MAAAAAASYTWGAIEPRSPDWNTSTHVKGKKWTTADDNDDDGIWWWCGQLQKWSGGGERKMPIWHYHFFHWIVLYLLGDTFMKVAFYQDNTGPFSRHTKEFRRNRYSSKYTWFLERDTTNIVLYQFTLWWLNPRPLFDEGRYGVIDLFSNFGWACPRITHTHLVCKLLCFCWPSKDMACWATSMHFFGTYGLHPSMVCPPITDSL